MRNLCLSDVVAKKKSIFGRFITTMMAKLLFLEAVLGFFLVSSSTRHLVSTFHKARALVNKSFHCEGIFLGRRSKRSINSVRKDSFL